jgi:hypothetical protein
MRKFKSKVVQKNIDVSNDRWIVPVVCLFLGALTWLVFGQTVHFQFVNFDDNEYVYKNLQIARRRRYVPTILL